MFNIAKYVLMLILLTPKASIKARYNKKNVKNSQNGAKCAFYGNRFLQTLYFSMERPLVEYIDKNYMQYINVSSKRVQRSDPVHYLSVAIKIVKTLPNTTRMEFLWYEFLSNEYRRTFVEMYFSLCDALKSKFYFGEAFRKSGFKCPTAPGSYKCNNMFFGVNEVARNFPFTKGRWFFNGKIDGKYFFKAQCDFELKEVDMKNVTHPLISCN